MKPKPKERHYIVVQQVFKAHTYHWFSWLEAGQRSDWRLRVVECISNVSIVDTSYPHHHITHLTTQPAVNKQITVTQEKHMCTDQRCLHQYYGLNTKLPLYTQARNLWDQ